MEKPKGIPPAIKEILQKNTSLHLGVTSVLLATCCALLHMNIRTLNQTQEALTVAQHATKELKKAVRIKKEAESLYGECDPFEANRIETAWSWIYDHQNEIRRLLASACQSTDLCNDPDLLITDWERNRNTVEVYCGHVERKIHEGPNGLLYQTYATTMRYPTPEYPGAFSLPPGFEGRSTCQIVSSIVHELMHTTYKDFEHLDDPIARQSDFIHTFDESVQELCEL